MDWQTSALQKGRICFGSFVLLFLVNNILDFGSVIFCCRAASLGKNKSFTENKVHILLASPKLLYFLSQIYQKNAAWENIG